MSLDSAAPCLKRRPTSLARWASLAKRIPAAEIQAVVVVVAGIRVAEAVVVPRRAVVEAVAAEKAAADRLQREAVEEKAVVGPVAAAEPREAAAAT